MLTNGPYCKVLPFILVFYFHNGKKTDKMHFMVSEFCRWIFFNKNGIRVNFTFYLLKCYNNKSWTFQVVVKIIYIQVCRGSATVPRFTNL